MYTLVPVHTLACLPVLGVQIVAIDQSGTFLTLLVDPTLSDLPFFLSLYLFPHKSAVIFALFPLPRCSHVNRTTQYENPVMEAKRRHAGAQLPNRQNPPVFDHRGPPPMRAPPPSFQSAAAMEKQLEAEAAARWPEAGFGGEQIDGGHYPYPYSAPPINAEHDLESELKGDTLTVTLLKTMSGFGFTIIGGDRAGELLQIKSIVRGSVAERDGRLQIGDVLVRINGISVLSYSHKKVVELFQSIPLDSDVQIEVRRGYPLPGGDELPPYVPDSGGRRYNDPLPGPPQFQSPPPPPSQPEKLIVNIVKGPLGFGFSLGQCE